MRFIVMHKVDAVMESGAPPEPDLIKNMGGLIGESIRSGVFLDGAGLHRSARRVRLRADGTLEKGPYSGRNELVSSMAMIRTASIDHAVEQAKRFAKALGGVEIEIGPVVEAWDISGSPKPKDAVGERFLLLIKSDERETPRDEAPLRALTDELSQTGVLLKLERIAPSATGARFSAGSSAKRTWTDGPFAESKELIAGFSLLEVPSKSDAIAWANRYAEILTGSEVDVRRMAD